jgi:hypothetical protein
MGPIARTARYVKAFWDKIKASYAHKEYMTHPERLYGIGVVQK